MPDGSNMAVIAYRNPVEAWLWQSGYVWPVLSIAVVLWVVFAARMFLRHRRNMRRMQGRVSRLHHEVRRSFQRSR